jgi:3-methylcrotonyl-CoA carboxylase alpha subunit
MKVKLDIGSRKVDCDVHEDGGGALSVSVEGRAHRVLCHPSGRNGLGLEIDGKRLNAYVCRAAGGKQIVIEGRAFTISEVLETAGAAGAAAAGEGAGDVTPPMPSEVVRILVAEGERVQKGQPLLVVSAMKMEMSLKSPRDGVVARIRTQVGAKVMPGSILVDIETRQP